MGKIGRKNQKPLTHYQKAFYSFLALALFSSALIGFAFFTSEELLFEMFADQKLIGNASQRSGQMTQMYIINTYGKTGLIIFIAIGTLVCIYQFHKNLKGYLRYRKEHPKEKIIKPKKPFKQQLSEKIRKLYDEW